MQVQPQGSKDISTALLLEEETSGKRRTRAFAECQNGKKRRVVSQVWHVYNFVVTFSSNTSSSKHPFHTDFEHNSGQAVVRTKVVNCHYCPKHKANRIWDPQQPSRAIKDHSKFVVVTHVLSDKEVSSQSNSSKRSSSCCRTPRNCACIDSGNLGF